MTNYISAGRGVLVLTKVTPVIQALFGPFKLDAASAESGAAFIAVGPQDDNPTWQNIYVTLSPLISSLSLETQYLSDDDLPAALQLIAAHFHVQSNPILVDLLRSHPFGGKADLSTLFLLARLFNDGHGLTAIRLGTAHFPRDGQSPFGGAGSFISDHLRLTTSSEDGLTLGDDLHRAIESDDLDQAASRIAGCVQTILDSVSKPEIRQALHWRLADLLVVAFQDSERRS